MTISQPNRRAKCACGKVTTVRGARNHLRACLATTNPGGPPTAAAHQTLKLITAKENAHGPAKYLLATIMPGSAALKALDSLLRHHWFGPDGYTEVYFEGRHYAHDSLPPGPYTSRSMDHVNLIPLIDRADVSFWPKPTSGPDQLTAIYVSAYGQSKLSPQERR